MKLGYIAVKLDKKQEAELISDIEILHIEPLEKDSYHCTVIYDERECDEPRCDIDPEKLFKAHVVGIEVLGKGLVFMMTSKDILDEHDRLKAAGFEHSYPDLCVHMSLTYTFDEYDVIKAKQHLTKWMGRELTFSREYLEDLQ